MGERHRGGSLARVGYELAPALIATAQATLAINLAKAARALACQERA
jgi:hypothetical protein